MGVQGGGGSLCNSPGGGLLSSLLPQHLAQALTLNRDSRNIATEDSSGQSCPTSGGFHKETAVPHEATRGLHSPHNGSSRVPQGFRWPWLTWEKGPPR